MLGRRRARMNETQFPGKTDNILRFQYIFRVGWDDKDAASDQAELGWEEEEAECF